MATRNSENQHVDISGYAYGEVSLGSPLDDDLKDYTNWVRDKDGQCSD